MDNDMLCGNLDLVSFSWEPKWQRKPHVDVINTSSSPQSSLELPLCPLKSRSVGFHSIQWCCSEAYKCPYPLRSPVATFNCLRCPYLASTVTLVKDRKHQSASLVIKCNIRLALLPKRGQHCSVLSGVKVSKCSSCIFLIDPEVSKFTNRSCQKG